MSVEMKIMGIDKMITTIHELSEKQKRRMKLALDSVLIEIVNWIKDNHQTLGGWKDQTGALNNSISYSESSWNGDMLMGIISAGPEYAIYVEFKEGHWVLSGGFHEFRGKIMNMIAERCKF
jgi:uncharacterized membrane protein YoaT (DUF817 family)